MPEPLTPEQEAAARKIRPSFEGHSDDCELCLLAAALATIDALRAELYDCKGAAETLAASAASPSTPKRTQNRDTEQHPNSTRGAA